MNIVLFSNPCLFWSKGRSLTFLKGGISIEWDVVSLFFIVQEYLIIESFMIVIATNGAFDRSSYTGVNSTRLEGVISNALCVIGGIGFGCSYGGTTMAIMTREGLKLVVEIVIRSQSGEIYSLRD